MKSMQNNGPDFEFVLNRHASEAEKDLRQKVFVDEQGFWDEFDELDDKSYHLDAMDNDKCLGCCRFYETEDGTWILGRMAVDKEARQKQIGSAIMRRAAEIIKERGGKQIRLHSQIQAVPFYESNGYETCSGIEPEQDYPHIWMKLNL